MGLQRIQTYVQQVAEVMASAINVEVEVVDYQLMRVAGTGRLRGVVGLKQTRGHVAKHVMQAGLTFTVKEPGCHWVCHDCELADHCFYTAGIFHPIIFEGASLGVLSLISFNEEQRAVLVANERSLLDFVARIADLITAKLQESEQLRLFEHSAQQLEALVGNLVIGLVGVDQEGRINLINELGKDYLQIGETEALGHRLEELLPDSLITSVLHSGSALEREIVISGHETPRVFVVSVFPTVKQEQVIGAMMSMIPLEKLPAGRVLHRHRPILAGLEDMMGISRAVLILKNQILKYSCTTQPIWVIGGPGSGKTFVARVLHSVGVNPQRPFVEIECRGLSPAESERELFGPYHPEFNHVKGKWQLAAGGTLLISQVEYLPLALQEKIFNLYSSASALTLAHQPIRLVLASEFRPEELQNRGLLSESWDRTVNAVVLEVPPLRRRKADIPLLAEYFFGLAKEISSSPCQEVGEEVMDLFLDYDWPGNLTELGNVVEYALTQAKGLELTPEDLPPGWQGSGIPDTPAIDEERFKHQMQEAEREVLRKLLEEYHGSINDKETMARKLGVSKSTVYRKLKRYGLA